VPGSRDVDNPLKLDRTDLKLKLDAEKAALLGVPSVEFDRAVRLAVSGVDAGDYRERDGESYDIVVRTPIDGRPTLEQLDQVRVPSA
jgi:multidrug efflux pump subunit AcrB